VGAHPARRAVAVVDGPIDTLRSVVRRSRDEVSVLIYHRVGRRSPSPVDLSLDEFRTQLDRLQADADVLGLDTAVSRLLGSGGREQTGRPAVVLTFDDGTADWLEVVLPELVARGLPATFYVSTDYVEAGRPFPDEGRPVSWAGLADMISSGLATIGSHTHTHRVLARARADEAMMELDRSVGLIEDRLGFNARHFAYPKAIAPSPAAEVVVRRRFVTAALAGNRVNVAGRTDLHRLGRHGLTVADDLGAVARKAAGGAWFEGWLRERRDAAWA
jgi:peptidoglycan/xylan/chitin deacetylase (PgdA/CDA1 family)